MRESVKRRIAEGLSKMDELDMLSWGILLIACMSIIGWLLHKILNSPSIFVSAVGFFAVSILVPVGIGAALRSTARYWLKKLDKNGSI